MTLKIISLICVILVSVATGIFVAFIIFHLKEIKDKTDSIPKRHWCMTVYMDEIPQDEIPQDEHSILHLGSVPLKIYEKGEYSDLPVPHIGEEVGGIYYSGQRKFGMEGIVTNVHYNIDLDLIVVSCKCTEIRIV